MVNSENQFEKNGPRTYEMLMQAEIGSDHEATLEQIIEKVERPLFDERIGQFAENDLAQDADGSWNTFEQKVRDVFPDFPEGRFRAIKAAVSMHLCGL